MAPIFFNPTHTKLQKNIFSFGGFKRAGGGVCVQSVIFLGQKFTILLFFKKKVPRNMIKKCFWKFSKNKSPYFKEESYVLAKIFGGVGVDF